jgi:hypothetical protein
LHRIRLRQLAGITINQSHMPYPLHIRDGGELNDYLQNTVAPKSLAICSFLGCSHIVVHGFKLASFLGSKNSNGSRPKLSFAFWDLTLRRPG